MICFCRRSSLFLIQEFKNMGKRIVAFGEIVWDILPNGKILGGTPSNMVYRCNSFGESGFLLSRIGNDEQGVAALNQLRELGISDENVQVDNEFPTGTVRITFDEYGEAVYDVEVDVAFDHIEFSLEALKLARSADCLFYGLLAQRYGISKNTIRELIKESPSALKFFDLKLVKNYFNSKTAENLLVAANLVRIKEKEMSFIGHELGIYSSDIEQFSATLCRRYNIDLLLITRGENGVFAFSPQQGAFYDEGYKIKMKDNIGSGIAFSAGFLHYYLNGATIFEALRFGNAAGALNATLRGATQFFSKEQVLNFMKNVPQREK